jgi:hypothetical protein
MKKWIFLIIVLAAVTFVLTTIPKTIEMPDEAYVISMEMEMISDRESLGKVTTKSKEDIETVISSLEGSLKTLRQSTNDYPIQKDYFILRLILEGEVKTLCLYADKGAYYIEEPYVGIYKSSKDKNNEIYMVYTENSLYYKE